MGMTLKELLTKGEGTLTAGEAKTLASQCRMDVETLYTLLEERGIKILDDEADGDTSLDVEGIMAEVESAEANSDELGLGDENEDDPAEENPADLKAAMDELLDDPVKNYLKQIGQIPLLSAEQEVDLSKRIHAGAEAAHILQADRQKYGAPEYIKKNSARFSFEEDENSRSYTEDLDEDGNTKSSEDDEGKGCRRGGREAGGGRGSGDPGAGQTPRAVMSLALLLLIPMPVVRFPLVPVPPTCREAWIVCLADNGARCARRSPVVCGARTSRTMA